MAMLKFMSENVLMLQGNKEQMKKTINTVYVIDTSLIMIINKVHKIIQFCQLLIMIINKHQMKKHKTTVINYDN